MLPQVESIVSRLHCALVSRSWFIFLALLVLVHRDLCAWAKHGNGIRCQGLLQGACFQRGVSYKWLVATT